MDHLLEDKPRPSPDELLEKIQSEEERERRGKLKIFLGYAPGVGKTYAMLEAARQRKEIDLVVAYVETHGRAETETLLNGLKIIPRKQMQYRSMLLTEMDLDAVLERKPQLALVDELAHTNASGSRHPKRYQDIEELLEAGIDVYTTLNIQHIESLRSTIQEITGIWMHEIVPDTLIDRATEIELVDLPVEDLLKRLKDGKIYIPEQIARAVSNFFRKGNLGALRELAMRITADHIDNQVLAYKEAHDISKPWSIAERLLVCIGPGQLGNRLIYAARNLAHQLNAEWHAIYVETPGNVSLPSDQQDYLNSRLHQAERLGAKVNIIQGDSIVSAILDYAKSHNITKIIVGEPRRSFWRNIINVSDVSQLIRLNKYFDIYVVGASRDSPIIRHGRYLDIYHPTGRKRVPKDKTIKRQWQPSLWQGYLSGIALVFIATLIGQLIRDIIDPSNIIMFYLLGVLISAFYFGFGPSILVSILSVLVFDFFLVPPYLTFAVGDTQYILSFITFTTVAIIVSYLASRVRQQTNAWRRKESETATLYSLSKDLTSEVGVDFTIRAIIGATRKTIGSHAAVFLPDHHDEGRLKKYIVGPDPVIDENELAIAVWAYKNQKIAGHNTDTIPDAKLRYMPLSTSRGVIGVLGVQSTDSKQLTIEQERLLKNFADLAAVAIERAQLAEIAHNAQLMEGIQRMQTALLNSISHDLRTPLVSIVGALSSLEEDEMNLDTAAKNDLIRVARDEAERLNHLIANLLDISRIEAGAIKLSKQPSDIQDIVGAALEQVRERVNDRQIRIEIPEGLPLMPVDFGLIVQVLVNILDNALKFSPAGSPIDIKVNQADKYIQIEVADRGMGIPPQNLSRVFDKFYRVQTSHDIAGTGLGLAICKGFIEAHGGNIIAENRQDGGTIIRFSLPLAKTNEREHHAESRATNISS